MNGIYLGGDGGGTSCRIAAWDENGTMLALARGPSSNSYVVGFDQAIQTVQFLITEVLTKVGKRSIISFCFGNSGLAREEERVRWTAFFEQFLGAELPILLVPDIELLLAMNDPRRLGLCLVSGTGSVALGRNEAGDQVRSGGMGSALGDEGSAWWIADQGIRRTLRSVEGRDQPTTMGPALLEFFGLPTYQRAISFFNAPERTKAEIARFAPIVSQAATQSDTLADAIITAAVAELALLVHSVQERLSEPYLKKITLAGGVLQHNQRIYELLINVLDPALEVHLAEGGGLEGARILARHLS